MIVEELDGNVYPLEAMRKHKQSKQAFMNDVEKHKELGYLCMIEVLVSAHVKDCEEKGIKPYYETFEDFLTGVGFKV